MPFLTISLTYIIHSNDSHLSYLSPSPVKSYLEDRGRGMTQNQISLELREGSLSVEVVTGRCHVGIMGKHDPNKPQSKMSLYNFFMYTCCDEYKKRHHDMWDNIGEFSKNKRWKTLSAKEKQKFKDLAKREKSCYDLETKNYVLPKGDKIKKCGGDPIDQDRPLSASFCFSLTTTKDQKWTLWSVYWRYCKETGWDVALEICQR